jgi:hypothetical protein
LLLLLPLVLLLWDLLVFLLNKYKGNVKLACPVNDQTKFAEWVYKSTFENGGNCKESGESCLLAIDPRYQKGRVVKIK